MKQIIVGGYTDSLSATATEYNALFGGNVWTATVARERSVIAASGVLRNFRVRLAGAPGAGTSFTITVMKNGAATSMAVTISDTNTEAVYTSELSVSAGDYINLRSTYSGAPTARVAWWSVEFEGSDPTYSIVSGNNYAANGDSATQYSNCYGTQTSWDTTEANAEQIMPCAGTIRDLYVVLSAAPGTNGRTITLRKNGASTSVTTGVITTATTASDTTHSFTVAAGDRVCVQGVSGGNITNGYESWGFVFIPDNAGEAVVLGGLDDVLSATATEYSGVTSYQDWSTSTRSTLANACRLKNFYVKLSAAPGSGTSYTLTIQDDGVDTALAVTIADTNTTGNSGSTQVSVSSASNLRVKQTHSGTPGTPFAVWGFVIEHYDLSINVYDCSNVKPTLA